MTTNALTITEARDILRCAGFGGRVSPRLEAMALAVVNAAKPVVVYPPMDWFEDDGSEDRGDVAGQIKASANRDYDMRKDIG